MRAENYLIKIALGCFTAFAPLAMLASVSFAGIIGPKDNRMTYPEYAAKNYGGNVAEVYRKFSAAGRFWCANSVESATVVRRNDILVTAAHSVLERKGGRCVQRPNLSQCYFQPVTAGGYGRHIYIRPETMKVSRNQQCNFVDQFNTDWAIFRLRQPATEVIPFDPVNASDYGTAYDGFARLKKVTVTAITAQNEQFRGFKAATPAICDGHLAYVWNMGVKVGAIGNYAFGTDCSSMNGASGGAIVVSADSSSPKYIGLISVSQDDTYNFQPLSDTNFTGSPLLHGEFYDALMGE